jgi:hypothetical protein
MKKEVKDRWVEALRSGKYSQTKGVLRDGKGFCCLGVLCDIAKDELGINWRFNGRSYDMKSYSLVLPTIVTEWAGLRDDQGMVFPNNNDTEEPLFNPPKLNDNGASFAEIADMIEQNWEKM